MLLYQPSEVLKSVIYMEVCFNDNNNNNNNNTCIHIPDSKQCRQRYEPHLARMDFTRARCGPDLGQHYVAVWDTHIKIIKSIVILIIYNNYYYYWLL